MPLFFDPNLLFIHIPKNAGRSIESVFMDTTRNVDWGRPNLINRVTHYGSIVSRSNYATRHLVGTRDITVAAQHLTYAEIEWLGLLQFTEVKRVFCVCRNPFDRVFSTITHFSGQQEGPRQFERTLEEWLDLAPTDHNQRAHRRTQLDFVLDRRGREVDIDILRFESLASDFSKFTEKIGKSGLSLPWRGKSTRLSGIEEMLTQRSKDIITREFSEDFDHFGYSTRL